MWLIYDSINVLQAVCTDLETARTLVSERLKAEELTGRLVRRTAIRIDVVETIDRPHGSTETTWYYLRKILPNHMYPMGLSRLVIRK